MAERRHVKDDIVEIAGLKVRHKVKEFLRTKLRGSGVGRRHRRQIEILRSGIHGAGARRLKSCAQRVGRLASKEGMNILRPQIYINQKDLTVTGFRKSGGEAGCKCRSSRSF